MITPTQQKIRDKTITAQQWADMVKSGDWISTGSVGGDATACVDALSRRLGNAPGQIKEIEFWSYGMYYPQTWLLEADREEKYHCIHEGFFFPWERKTRDIDGTIDWQHWGWAIGVWFSYYRFLSKEKAKRGWDWAVRAVSPPEGGYFNFSYGTNNGMIFSKLAKKVVLEVREDYPWAEPGANNLIHIDEVDYIIKVDCDKYRWPQLPEARPSEVETRIADNILKIMDDGDCIQIGIGALPTAIARAISKAGLRHLGVHTEMMQEGVMALMAAGSVDNSLKPIDRGKSVWTFAFPFNRKRYYDFIHRNHSLAVYDINYVNNICQLSRIDHLIAIDNFIAIDLYGQLCAGHYAGRPISGTGGFFNFIAFSPLAKGGRGVAAATSRSKAGTPRIVPQLPPGSVVDVPAQLVSWVATEYGLVNLAGLSGYERVRALISIAHPDDRQNLEREAYKLNLLPKKFPVPMIGRERRYPDYAERKDFKIPYASSLWGYDWLDDLWSGK